jgi:hypothetical protein
VAPQPNTVLSNDFNQSQVAQQPIVSAPEPKEQQLSNTQQFSRQNSENSFLDDWLKRRKQIRSESQKAENSAMQQAPAPAPEKEKNQQPPKSHFSVRKEDSSADEVVFKIR